jgi:hypothetical protein
MLMSYYCQVLNVNARMVPSVLWGEKAKGFLTTNPAEGSHDDDDTNVFGPTMPEMAWGNNNQ